MSKSLTDIRSLARSYTELAVQKLAGIAQNGKSESAVVAACEALLNRGWGKPPNVMQGDEDGGPIVITWQKTPLLAAPVGES